MNALLIAKHTTVTIAVYLFSNVDGTSMVGKIATVLRITIGRAYSFSKPSSKSSKSSADHDVIPSKYGVWPWYI